MSRLWMLSAMLAAVVAASMPSPLRADPPAAALPRAEIPIREVKLPNGEPRFAVPIKVGTRTVVAVLDTGSLGLRVLRRALAAGDANETQRVASATFGSGVTFDGVVANATLTVGALSGPAALQLVNAVSCAPQAPHCSAALTGAAPTGVQGNGFSGQGAGTIPGVDAILGILPRVGNPLVALGVRRWIVELPRPGEHGPGRLVLNPTDEELAGFVLMPATEATKSGVSIVPLFGPDAYLSGCLTDDETKAQVCGPVLPDTDGDGVVVVNGGAANAWPQGSAARLAFTDAQGRTRALERLTVGAPTEASGLTFIDSKQLAQQMGQPFLSQFTDAFIAASVNPYYAFAVLYDPYHRMIGLKARPPARGGPVGSTE